MNEQDQPDINTIIQNGYSVDIGAFLSRGWEIFRSNLVLFVGFELFNLGVDTALSLMPLERVFLVGTIAPVIIVGVPLYAGELFVALKVAKGETVSFGDFFKGFQKAYFSKLLLTSLVMGILIGLGCLLAGISFSLSGIGSILSRSFASGRSPNFTIMVVIIPLIVLGLLGTIYLSVAYFFAIPIVMGLRMEFWPAMETSRKLVNRNWFGIFGLVLILVLMCFCGYLLFGLGALITNPLAICVTIAAYEHIIGLAKFDSSQA
jgi:uncharacterized membrane protein